MCVDYTVEIKKKNLVVIFSHKATDRKWIYATHTHTHHMTTIILFFTLIHSLQSLNLVIYFSECSIPLQKQDYWSWACVKCRIEQSILDCTSVSASYRCDVMERRIWIDQKDRKAYFEQICEKFQVNFNRKKSRQPKSNQCGAIWMLKNFFNPITH